MRRLAVLALSIAAIGAIPAPAGAAVVPKTMNVTSCGTVIPKKTIGILQNDIADCLAGSALGPQTGIQLLKNAKLDLNGHTITFDQGAGGDGPVGCVSTCEVYGPGTLTNGFGIGGGGVVLNPKAKASVHDLSLSNFTIGVYDPSGNTTLSHVSMNVYLAGTWVARKITADHVDITLTSAMPGSCLEASQPGGSIDVTDSTLTNCGEAILATRKVTAARVTVTNALRFGVHSGGKLTITDSSVTGSTLVDISSKKMPVITNATCGTSNWHVCAND